MDGPRRLARDDGDTAAEYVVVLLLVALVPATLATSGIVGSASRGIELAVCNLFGGTCQRSGPGEATRGADAHAGGGNAGASDAPLSAPDAAAEAPAGGEPLRAERSEPDRRGWLRRAWHALFDVTTGYEAADHPDTIARVAEDAGVDPRTPMAIIEMESAGRQRWPGNWDWPLVWFRGDRGSIGIGSMQRRVFAEVASRHPEVAGQLTFEEAEDYWPSLIHDGGLAIRAVAYHLADLDAQLAYSDGDNRSPYTRQQLLAIGYNAGVDNMEAIYTGTTAGSAASSYAERFAEVFGRAHEFYCESADWSCAP